MDNCRRPFNPVHVRDSSQSGALSLGHKLWFEGHSVQLRSALVPNIALFNRIICGGSVDFTASWIDGFANATLVGVGVFCTPFFKVCCSCLGWIKAFLGLFHVTQCKAGAFGEFKVVDAPRTCLH